MDDATSLVGKLASSKLDEIRGFDYVSDGKRHWFRVNALDHVKRFSSDSRQSYLYLNF